MEDKRRLREAEIDESFVSHKQLSRCMRKNTVMLCYTYNALHLLKERLESSYFSQSKTKVSAVTWILIFRNTQTCELETEVGLGPKWSPCSASTGHTAGGRCCKCQAARTLPWVGLAACQLSRCYSCGPDLMLWSHWSDVVSRTHFTILLTFTEQYPSPKHTRKPLRFLNKTMMPWPLEFCFQVGPGVPDKE